MNASAAARKEASMNPRDTGYLQLPWPGGNFKKIDLDFGRVTTVSEEIGVIEPLTDATVCGVSL